jgi:heparin binding hemagglutinin HbhA
MATTNKTNEQSRFSVNTVFDQVRAPLLAALGAGELTTQAAYDAFNKARSELNERTESVRSLSDDLPKDFGQLREKFDPTEMRKLLDDYTQAALDLYKYLVEHGEKAVDKVRSQEQVRKAIEQVEEAVQAAQTRFDDVTGDAREMADDVLGRVTKRTRSFGERAARTTKDLADQAAEAVTEAGEDVAGQTRSVSRQVANSTDPKRKTTGSTGSASTGSTSTGSTSTGSAPKNKTEGPTGSANGKSAK